MKPIKMRSDRLAIYGIILIAGCSTSNHLRRFEEGDIGKEISADVAKRFEVKDLSASTPTPTPVPVSDAKVKTKTKAKEKKKKVGAVVAPTATPQPLVVPNRRMEPMPFDTGERLSYDLRYVGVTAATFQTEVLPPKLVSDRKVYDIKAHAKTVSLFELVYRVDDRMESFFDYEGLFSHRFTMDLDETKQNRKVIQLNDNEKAESFYWNRVDHVEKGFKEQKETHSIPAWAQDPLSALFYLRAAPLPSTQSGELHMPVILDGKPLDTVIRYLRTESIYAGGKDREARVYRLENYENGQLKNKDNFVWLSTDEHRYLLRVETKMKMGSFAVALDKIL